MGSSEAETLTPLDASQLAPPEQSAPRSEPDPPRPALAADVQLAGLMPSVSFQDAQWLVQRSGQFIQVSELLYRVLEQTNGVRTLEEIAAAVTDATDWLVDSTTLRRLVETKLLPLGLITLDGRHPSAVPPAAASPLGVGMRMKMLSPRFVHAAAESFKILFAPVLLVPMLAAVTVGHVWMYGVRGVSSSMYSVLYTPGALLAVFAVVVAAGLFHELGHAAGLRYGGGRARGIGAGLYLIFPAFYTDVTDSYLLGRTARLRTDLGGVYFHSIFSLALIVVAAFTGSHIALLSAVLINVDVLRQFIPFVRLDGYWILADITGIPDFFSQMGPFVRSILPGRRWQGTRLPPLRPAARAVFVVYTLAVVPVLIGLFVLMIVRLPWFLRMTMDALSHQAAFLSGAPSPVGWLLAVGQMLLLALPLAGTALILYTVLRGLATLAHGLLPAPVRHFAGGMAAAGGIFLLYMFVTSYDRPTGSTGSAAATPTAVDAAQPVIARARDAAAGIRTLSARVEGALGPDRFTGDLSLQRPNLARLQITGTKGLGTFQVVANDGTASIYFPADNQFSQFSAGTDGRNITGFFIEQVQHFFRPETLATTPEGGRAAYIGVEAVGGADADVIDIVPRVPDGRVARYYISREDGLVRRIAWRKPGGEATTWVELKDVRRDVQLESARFEWKAPANATPLQLPLTLRLPGVDGAPPPRTR